MTARRPAGLRVHAALALVQLFFGANAVFGKIALGAVSPAALLGVRVPMGAALFLLLRWAMARTNGWERLQRTDLGRAAYLSLLGVSLNQLLYFEGLSRASVTNVAVLGATIPVFAAGFSIALGHERATPLRLSGLATALAGALLVVLLGRPGRGAVRLEFGFGEACIVVNSAVYALYLVLARPLFQRYRTETAITWIFAIAALMLLPFGLLPMAHELPAASAAAKGSIVFIVLGPTVGAYFLNGYALQRAPASLVAVYIYAQPVIAAGLAQRLLGERLSIATGFGGTLIGIGIAMVSLSAGPAWRKRGDGGTSPGGR
jgi:drug/metabolite transporter (DMT)-like permease